MPLFSEHISNMYYSGSPSYTGSSYGGYSSSVSPLGLSYSSSYLNPGGNYSSHSSLGGYSRTPLPSRWISSVGRNYSPMLSTISERSTASPVRISSPRRLPLSKRSYTTSTYTPRPININTETIDVSRDKYRRKNKSPSPVRQYEKKSIEKENSPFMPRVDGKPETGIDSSPGQKHTIKRDRTVVRLHTLKRKERDSPRKPIDVSPMLENTNVSVIKKQSEELNKDSSECFVLREKSPKANEEPVQELKVNTENVVPSCELQSLPVSPLPSTSKSPDRRLSMELLAEQACLFDSLIRKENLSTATLDLSKVGIVGDSTPSQLFLDEVKSNRSDNPLKTTKSDHSLHASLKSTEPKNLIKRRSLKKSSSGGSICRLDSITEFPKDLSLTDLPVIVETKQPIQSDQSDPKPKLKLKTKITSSVDISPPKSPLKFRVENVTVEEKLKMPKKEITYSCEVDETISVPLDNTITLRHQTDKGRRSIKMKSKKMNISFQDDDPTSPDPEDGNFWNKIGKRETVYLTKRKQFIDETKEKSKRELFWFPEDESGSNEDLIMDNSNDVNELQADLPNEKLPDTEEVHTEEEAQVCDNNELKATETIPNEVLPAFTKDIANVSCEIQEKEEEINKKENIIVKETIQEPNSIIVIPETSKADIVDLELTKEVHVIDTTVIKSEPSANSEYLTQADMEIFKSIKANTEEPTLMERSKSENSTHISDQNNQSGCFSTSLIVQDKELTILEQPDKKVDQTNMNVKSKSVTEKVYFIDKPTDIQIYDKSNTKKGTSESLSEDNNPDKATKFLQKDEEKVKSLIKKPATSSSKKPPKAKQSTEQSNSLIKKVSKQGKPKDSKKAASTQVNNNELKTTIETDCPLICSEKPSISDCDLPIVDEKTPRPHKLEESFIEAAVTDNKPSSDKILTDVCQTTMQITENIPTKEDEIKDILIMQKKQDTGEDQKADIISNKNDNQEEVKQSAPVKAVIKTPPIINAKKIVKEQIAPKPLIATPRPLQKRAPQVIHSSSSSESSSDEESSEEEETESSSSEGTVEFFECENNPDGRTSTGSNDSGFDSSAPTSPATFHQIRKGGDTPGTSSSAPAQDSVPDIFEQELEQSTAYSLFRKTGRFTPPARSIPRFRKYTIEDFHFVKVLGKGSFGKVLLAELRDTEYYYAVKCLKKDVVLEDDDVECTLIERKVLALGTNHPYLCHLFATFQTDSHLFFVMEYLNGGDLMFHIQQSGRFPEVRARFYGAEIVSGLKFLHKRGIVYRDLKLDNILLDFDGHVRIADFGMCKLQIYLDKTADTFCGTPDYMAPEIIKGLKYNQAVDWWSFGVLLYEMLIGQSPFSGCDEDELFWSICNEMPSYPRFLSKEALSILTRLLDKDARTRLGGSECMHGDVREQEFFRPLHWDRLERRDLEAPFRPRVRHPLDTQYFDRAFTGERPRLTTVEPHVLRSMDQEPFRGFSYTNPNATDH